MHTIDTGRAGTSGVLDVFGPTIELLTPPSDADAPYCVIRGTIPPGAVAPLHSHADAESFYQLSGSSQVLRQRGDRLEWLDVRAGELVHIAGGEKHAWRNTSTEPSVSVFVTTPRLGRFFQEVGRPVTPGAPPLPPPSAEELQYFMQVAEKYGHWVASPEENRAVGIPGF